jgi:hypothetical protein
MEPGSLKKETRGTLEVEVFSDSDLAAPGEMIGFAIGPCKGCEEIVEGDYAEDDENDWWCSQCWTVEEKVRLKARVAELEADVENLKKHITACSWKIEQNDREMEWYKWYRGDDSGVSSETIFQVMTGISVRWTGTPMDSDDFGRCFRLLEKFPHWRDRLDEVAAQFPEWKGLVDNWSKLEFLYKREKHNEVYEFIKACYEQGKNK